MLACDDEGLMSLRFDVSEREASDHPILEESAKWLDVYFSGGVPDFTPSLKLKGTAFQLRVWDFLRSIPYGHTMTYGRIAQALSCGSAQAVGQAVGHNPIAIILPCHRVIGSDGSLTGYSGGIERKSTLLKIEGITTKKITSPQSGRLYTFPSPRASREHNACTAR